MAVIVLSGADFSANNIGHIDLFSGFSSTTKQVFSKFNIVEDERNSMQIAVDEFIRAIVDNNLWGNGKITAMCLPFLTNLSSSPSVADAMQNVIADDNFFTSSDAASSLELYHNGIRPKIGQLKANIPFESSARGVYTNIHFAIFNIEDEPDHTINSGTGRVWCSMALAFQGIQITNNAFNLASSPSNAAGGDANYKKQSAMRIACYKSDLNDGKGVFYCNGQQSFSNDTNLQGTGLNQIGFGVLAGSYNSDADSTVQDRAVMQSPTGIMSVGSYLTGEEALVYTNAANNLVHAIHIYMD